MTGKEVAPLSSPVHKLLLSSSVDKYVAAQCSLRKKNRRHIEGADLICYPPGSFYSSLMANLLPSGVGQAVANNDNPKVYIPNLGQDPEQLGMTMDRAVATLLKRLRDDAGGKAGNEDLLNFVLMDSRNGAYASSLSTGRMADLGVQIIDVPLITKRSAPFYDARRLVAALLSLT